MLQKIIHFLLVLSASAAIVHCVSLPKAIKKCSFHDSNVKQCLSSTFEEAVKIMKDGIPELHMPTLQPLVAGSMKIGRGSGAVGLDQIYEDAKIYNIPDFKNVIVTDFSIKDPNNMLCHFEGHFWNITFASNFTGNGNILSIPIKVNGPFTVELMDTFAKFKISFMQIKKKGQVYLKVKEFGTDLHPKMIHYKLQNNLPDEFKIDINTILNDNALDVFADVKAGYDQAIGMVLKNVCNQVFGRVPYKELVLPEI